MKNVCIFDMNSKYIHIIKSFLLAQSCRVSVCQNVLDAITKLSLGIFDGLICVEDLPMNVYDIVNNLYENRIVIFYISNKKDERVNANYFLREPFSLLDFASLIKNFVSAMKKYECIYYVGVKRSSSYVNCVLENPTDYGGIIYPVSFTMNNMNIFNDFFNGLKDVFEVQFLDKNYSDSLYARPVSYEYLPNKLVKEVLINFLPDERRSLRGVISK